MRMCDSQFSSGAAKSVVLRARATALYIVHYPVNILHYPVNITALCKYTDQQRRREVGGAARARQHCTLYRDYITSLYIIQLIYNSTLHIHRSYIIAIDIIQIIHYSIIHYTDHTLRHYKSYRSYITALYKYIYIIHYSITHYTQHYTYHTLHIISYMHRFIIYTPRHRS